MIRSLHPPLVITGIYCAFAGLWIAASDQMLAVLFKDPHVLVSVSIYKGIAFVAVTGALLYGLLYRRELQHLAALDALALSEARFRATFEQAAVGIAHVGLDGRWLRVNQKLCDFLGYPRAELMAMTFQDVTHPDDLNEDLALVAELRAGSQRSYSLEKRYVTKSGQVAWASLTVALVARRDGRPDYFISVIEDISVRKRVEDALLQSEANYRELFSANPHPMWVFDRRTLRFLDVNAAAVSHYGYTREEFLAMTVRDIRPAEEVPRLERVLGAGLNGYDKLGVWTHRKKSGELIRVEVQSNDLNFQGQDAKMVLTHDITARERAEQALQEAMRRLTVLSARLIDVQEAERRSVARELHDDTGQSLTAIKIILQTIGRKHPELDDELRDAIGIADRSLTQVRELSRGLWPSQLDDLGLGPALNSMIQRLARHGNIKIALETPDALPDPIAPQIAATCFRVAQEALTNIVRHAGASAARVRLAADGDRLCLLVEDNGRGFPAAQALAEVGKSSLGLLGMLERAKLAGGELDIDSTPGAGTRVSLSLPLKDAA